METRTSKLGFLIRMLGCNDGGGRDRHGCADGVDGDEGCANDGDDEPPTVLAVTSAMAMGMVQSDLWHSPC